MLSEFELAPPLPVMQRPAAPEPVLTVAGLACSPVSERYAQLTGLPFSQVSLHDGRSRGGALSELFPQFPSMLVERIGTTSAPVVVTSAGGIIFYGVQTPQEGFAEAVVGGIPVDRTIPPKELVMAAAEAGWSQDRFDGWLARTPRCSSEVLTRLLRLAHNELRNDVVLHRSQRDAASMAEQLDGTYEELNLLHGITRHLRIGAEPGRVVDLCLRQVFDCLHAEGCAVMLQSDGGEPNYFAVGRLPVHALRLAEFVERSGNGGSHLPLVRNQLHRTPLGREFRGIDNCVAVELITDKGVIGWIAACNSERGEFGSPEANLLSSVGQILSTHLSNVRMFREQDALVIGFVRSMVSALDARDRYTCGHSHRVARIARRLARQLQLPADQVKSIYLSGLMHDLGKVGLPDKILKKPGRLTEEEFRIVQQHPVIGFEILSQLDNVQDVLPGVLHHHESVDGAGYPHGLVGDQIPLMARILAVADAYDAMASNRSYRGGMPIDRVEAVLTNGAGTQWDAEIVQALLACRDDVKRIWQETDAAESFCGRLTLPPV